MERYRKIISGVTPILQLLEKGAKPEDIKTAVVETLEPFFQNKGILEKLAIEHLIPDAITLSRLEGDEFFFAMFSKCLNTYRSAKATDTATCFKSIALLEPQIANSQTKFWSVMNLEVDKSTLGLEEFLHECLRNIGDFIENLAKPYLKQLLVQVRIERQTEATDVDLLDLGNIINELIEKTDYSELFCPKPWNIRLNQWRNISYHGTAKVVKDEIVCWYGGPTKLTEVRFSRVEMLQAVKTVYTILITLKLAYSIFVIDNLKEISKLASFSNGRAETDFISFASGLASQGFEIVNYNESKEETSLVVQDKTKLDVNQRRIHTTQFLYMIWELSKSKVVSVEYRENDGTPNLRTKVSGAVCEKVSNGELDFLDIARNFAAENLKKPK